MDENELRELVRASVAKHLGAPAGHEPALQRCEDASHARFSLLAPSDDRCLIEPAVACTHCGYCQSYGH